MIPQKVFSKLIVPITLWLLTSTLIFPNQIDSLWENSPEKKTLSNGLTLIYHKDKSSALTVLQIIIKGGKGAEPEGKRGLAYLTTSLALEIPDRGKVQDLMNQASRVYMMCRADFLLINIACLSEHLDKTLKIVTDIILNPLFSGMRIDRIKKRMLYLKKTYEDDPAQVGFNAYLEKLFVNTAYGGSVYGSEKSLKDIKKNDIKDFYQNYFKARNMIVAVATDMEEKELTEIFKKYFVELPEGESTEPKPKTVSIPEEKSYFIEKDTKQSFVSAAYPLPKLTPKNFALAFLLENLLGKGVNSRLWALRSKEKLAYNVNCIATQMKDGGILEAYLETDTEKKDTALEALKQVLNDLFENGVTEDELKVTKINSKASFLRSNETKETRTSNLASFEALGLGYEFLTTFFSEIDTASLEEINVFIKDILNPEKRVEIIIGPKKEEIL